MVKPETAKMLSIMSMVVPELANETDKAPAAPIQQKREEWKKKDDWKNKDGKKGDWKNGKTEDWKNGKREDWKKKDDWKNKDGKKEDWKNKNDWKKKDDWKKKEEGAGEEPSDEAPPVDDYIHFADDVFDQKSSSKLKKKFQAKQAFKDYMNTFRNQKSGENNQDSTQTLTQLKKKSKPTAKRPAEGKTQEYSSNWMSFLKKQKTETTQTTKTQKNVKNAKKPNQSAVLTPLRPIAGAYAGPTPLIAVDCEMVLVEGNVQALARCSIVNYNGHVLFDKLVRPTKKVENYLPKITGLSYSKLKNAGTFETYKEEIHNLLSGRTIVGHTLKGDFEVLKYLPEEHLIRDLKEYRALREDGKLLGLKKLTEKHLKFRIQTAEHDSNEDARAAMALYRKFEKQWEAELKEQRIAQNPIAPQKGKKTQKESAKEETQEEEQEEQEESENGEQEDEAGFEEEEEDDFDFNDLGGEDDDDDDGVFN